MIKLLIRRLIPNAEQTKSPDVRAKYALLTGTVGILCNLVLFLIKLIIGMLMNSIAITSDAFNNLSDLGSSVVSAVSTRLAGQRPDKEHPYGHGRLEYIASLFVSCVIIVVGIELMRSAFDKLIHPEPPTFQIVPLAILVLSILIKVWMWSYNRYVGRLISSTVLLATAADSISDVFATSVIVISTVASRYLPASIPLDGIMGIIVSLLICKTGITIAKETVDLLLGSSPDPETIKELEATILSDEVIVGVHDTMLHDYGPGRIFASAHAEVADDIDVIYAHERIDAIEHKIFNQMGIITVLHMDPISVGNEKVNAIRAAVTEAMNEINESYTLHDFRITDGEEHINLIFDIVVPIDEKLETTAENVSKLKENIKALDARYAAVIAIDHAIV